MSLHERIVNGPDRRETDVQPIIERREPRIPEWRRRAAEQQERVGFVAVADLTERAA